MAINLKYCKIKIKTFTILVLVNLFMLCKITKSKDYKITMIKIPENNKNINITKKKFCENHMFF